LSFSGNEKAMESSLWSRTGPVSETAYTSQKIPLLLRLLFVESAVLLLFENKNLILNIVNCYVTVFHQFLKKNWWK
jgi:hypothetical protein